MRGNIQRDGVEPRILGISIKPILLSSSKYSIVVRIPKSWNGPHRVIYGGHAKFYARNSSGKYEMDVDELRIAFNLAETLIEKIRNFRVDRIAKILADETPVHLYSNPKIIIHLIPINSFNPLQQYDIKPMYTNRHDKLPLIYRSVLNGRFNLDGLVTYSENDNGKFSAYTQLFRNGIVEAIDTLMLKPREINNTIIKIIPITQVEKKIIDKTTSYLGTLKELIVEPPIYAYLSLLNVRSYEIRRSDAHFNEGYPIDRDMLLFPEVIIDNYGIQAEEVLKPLFDLIWNACGVEESLNYDKNGNWVAG